MVRKRTLQLELRYRLERPEAPGVLLSDGSLKAGVCRVLKGKEPLGAQDGLCR